MDTITLTSEMQRAYDIIENSNDNIFITGKAGSGKTTLLKYIVENMNKEFMICAPTGVAAVNCHGATLHHQFRIPFGFLSPDLDPALKYDSSLEEVFQNIDAIVIDEVSMVKCDLIDYIDRSLRLYRKIDKPFGDLQMIFMGDMYQIPPVVKKEEEDVLGKFYEGPYFFYASVFAEKGFHVIELEHVFRQKEQSFVDMLNRIRVYEFTGSDKEMLRGLMDTEESGNFDNGAIHICTHRSKVAEINSAMLGVPTKEYTAKFTGNFSEASATCDTVLQLRIGARVMSLVNDPDKEFFNGSLGTVVALKDNEVDVRLDNGVRHTFTPHKWAEYCYKFHEGKVKQYERGTCEQIPLSLAWAITAHKSQGRQWDHITLHIGHVFAPGMIYVALSRCTRLDGIVTDTYITKRHIVVDKHLKSFYRAIQMTSGYFDKTTIKYII